MLDKVKYRIILGYICINLTISCNPIWGFFQIYLRNYYYYYDNKIYDSVHNVLFFMTAGIVFSNYFLPFFVNKFTPPMGFLLAIAIKCFAYVFYLKAKNQIILYFIGFIISFGEYVCQYKSQFEIVSLFPQEKGKVVGLMISGIALNVLFWSTCITKLVNPQNLVSNTDNIFPISVADNFSKFIIIFNICNLLIGIVGIYLI